MTRPSARLKLTVGKKLELIRLAVYAAGDTITPARGAVSHRESLRGGSGNATQRSDTSRASELGHAGPTSQGALVLRPKRSARPIAENVASMRLDSHRHASDLRRGETAQARPQTEGPDRDAYVHAKPRHARHAFGRIPRPMPGRDDANSGSRWWNEVCLAFADGCKRRNDQLAQRRSLRSTEARPVRAFAGPGLGRRYWHRCRRHSVRLRLHSDGLQWNLWAAWCSGAYRR